jgi:hypothetical protein
MIYTACRLVIAARRGYKNNARLRKNYKPELYHLYRSDMPCCLFLNIDGIAIYKSVRLKPDDGARFISTSVIDQHNART